MKNKPLVSIVTPSYNQGRFLEETMQSVIYQDYEPLEYIVIDGGSTDNSIEIIHKYEKQLAHWVSEPDKGQTDAINKGFAVAKGEIIAWLNSDDTYNPGAISSAVDFLTKNPEVGLVYSNLNFIGEHSRVIGKFPAAITDLKRLRNGYVHIPQPAAFFRRALWQQVGPLDPSFFFAMDYDLWVRLAGITQFHYIDDQTWANFRLHSDTKSISADDRCWPEMLRVHYRDGGKWLSPIVMKYALRKLAAPWLNRKRRKLINL